MWVAAVYFTFITVQLSKNISSITGAIDRPSLRETNKTNNRLTVSDTAPWLFGFNIYSMLGPP